MIRYSSSPAPGCEPLNLECPSGLLSARGLACRALLCCAWQHAVFAGDPALAASLQESGHAVVHRGRADDPRLAELNQDAAFSRGDEVRRDFHRPQLVRASSVASHSLILAGFSGLSCPA